MAENPITTLLPADLPTNWATGQVVAPTGSEVGLSEQHGYNYLMEQVNAAQEAAQEIGEAFSELYSTGDIVPVANGGTGITQNPSLLVNLVSTSAASVFAAEPRPGVTGTLPIAQGGTGATTAQDAGNSLSVWSLYGGTQLAANTDLNDVMTTGNYFNPSAHLTSGFSNCPLSVGAFVMRVFPGTGLTTNYMAQEIRDLEGRRFYRFYNQDTGRQEWEAWISLTPIVKSTAPSAMNSLSAGQLWAW